VLAVAADSSVISNDTAFVGTRESFDCLANTDVMKFAFAFDNMRTSNVFSTFDECFKELCVKFMGKSLF